jgi:CRISPR-associated protein Cmr2
MLTIESPKAKAEILSALTQDYDSAKSGENVGSGAGTVLAALAYCYFYDAYPDLSVRQYINELRVAALNYVAVDAVSSSIAKDASSSSNLSDYLIKRLRSDGGDQTVLTPPPEVDPAILQSLEEALQLAQMATGITAPSTTADATDKLSAAKIGLVMGGAAKIKDYVFESSSLPEIRGASALLDYINLELTPALFGIGSAAIKQRAAKYRGNLALIPEALIYANGGELLAFCPASQAAELARTIERMYAEETLVAQAVVAAQVFSLYEVRSGLPTNFKLVTNKSQESGFADLTGYLSSLRRRRQEFNPVVLTSGETLARRTLPGLATFPVGRRCDSCDRRLAVVKRPRFGSEQENLVDLDNNNNNEEAKIALCEPCARKAVSGQLQRKTGSDAWFRAAGFDWTPPENENWLVKANRLQYANRMARDLNEIADANPQGIASGFIGVIYGDGNNMGSLLKRIKTPVEYKEFASTVHATLNKAVAETLAKRLPPAPAQDKSTSSETYHPFEILSVGGDDIYLFVPGGYALDIAHAIAVMVEAELQTKPGFSEGKPKTQVERYWPGAIPDTQSLVGLSCGVLLVSANTPVFFINDLVDQLLKSAKKRAKDLRKENYHGATIDFMALKSVTMVTDNLNVWRKRTLERRPNSDSQGKILSLTARPYTLPEMAGLLATIRELKKENFDAIRGQLYQLREQLGQGELSAKVNYRYLVANNYTSQNGNGQKLEEIIKRWLPPTEKNNAPWRSDGENRLTTVINDLLELWDFIL